MPSQKALHKPYYESWLDYCSQLTELSDLVAETPKLMKKLNLRFVNKGRIVNNQNKIAILMYNSGEGDNHNIFPNEFSDYRYSPALICRALLDDRSICDLISEIIEKDNNKSEYLNWLRYLGEVDFWEPGEYILNPIYLDVPMNKLEHLERYIVEPIEED